MPGSDEQAALAGWYLDPVDRRLLRWWDGTRWTRHTYEWTSMVPTEPQAVPSDRQGRP